MDTKNLLKQNSEKISKIMLCLLTVEATVLLSIGIYNLVKDNSIITSSLIIFFIAYFIGGLKSIISKTNLQKQTRSIKKKIIIGVITFIFCIMLSAFRKNILASYFIGQQITILTIWFLIGTIFENIVVLIILLKKEETSRNKIG